jgi:hypothetical protein
VGSHDARFRRELTAVGSHDAQIRTL